jgi:intein-encoded DNA endonuclease-like protein
MGKRGPKPRGKVSIKWSANFAYAIGLIASDGSLSKDGRHISFTSKDKEQVENLNKALGVEYRIGKKSGGAGLEKKYFIVQFCDVLFYDYLLSIGITPNKSKTIGEIKIPKKYFFDFLRGSFDGDGCFYSYYDPRWKSSFMYYTTFMSASMEHIVWLRSEISKKLGIEGHITHCNNASVHQLKYAKQDSSKILECMYNDSSVICLSRKRAKIEKALAQVGKKLPT